MKNSLSMFLLCSIVLVGSSIMPASCSLTTSIESSIVQIWPVEKSIISGPLSYGIVVGDGSQVLTVFNFERELPNTLEIVQPGKGKYTGSIQDLDPRHSTILIKLDGVKLPTAKIAESRVKRGDEVTIYGWPGPEYKSLESTKTAFPGYDTVFMTDVGKKGFIASDGAAVTNKDGEVIGIIGTFYNAFVIRLGGPGSAPPMVDIQSALEILSPGFSEQPWVHGPVYTQITTLERNPRFTSPPPTSAKYSDMIKAFSGLIDTIGEPLPADELPADYRLISTGNLENTDGTLLTIVFPYQAVSRNKQHGTGFIAKWIGIQWERKDGQPNRILYGDFDDFGNAKLKGGFLLEGDITALENALR